MKRGAATLAVAIACAAIACNRTPPAPAALPPKDANDDVRIERAIAGEIREPFQKGRRRYLFVELTTLGSDVTPTRLYDESTGHCHRVSESPDRFLARQKTGTRSAAGARLRLSTVSDHVDYFAPGDPELCPPLPAGAGSRLDYRTGGTDRSVRFDFASGPTTTSARTLPAELAATPTPVAAATSRTNGSEIVPDDGPARTPHEAAPARTPAIARLDPDVIHLLAVSSANRNERVLAPLASPRQLTTGFSYSGSRAIVVPDGRLVQIDRNRALRYDGGSATEIETRSCRELSGNDRAGLSWVAYDLLTEELVQACNVLDQHTHGQVEAGWIQSVYVDGVHVPRRDRLTGEVLGPPVGGVFPARGCIAVPGAKPSDMTARCGFFLLPRTGDPIPTTVPRFGSYLVRSTASGFLVVPLEDGTPRELWKVGVSGAAQRQHAFTALPADVNPSSASGSLALGPDGALYQFGYPPRSTNVYRRDAKEARVVYSEASLRGDAAAGPYVRPHGSLETELVTGGAVSYVR